MKDLFNKVKNFVVTGKEKAIVGFFAGSIGSYLVANGLTVKDIWSVHGVQALAIGVATHILVYFTTNAS